MRRNNIVLTVVLTFGLVAGAPPGCREPRAAVQLLATRHLVHGLDQDGGPMFLGDASNRLFAALDGDCGEMMDGVFFMAAPIVGVELDCDVPAGSPIVLSPAGFFTTEGVDGNTDQELVDAAIAGFVTSTNELTLDGMAVPLQPIHTGAYDVVSEPGGFYDTIGVGTCTIRTALRANVVFLRPLTPGDHVIEGAVSSTATGSSASRTTCAWGELDTTWTRPVPSYLT